MGRVKQKRILQGKKKIIGRRGKGKRGIGVTWQGIAKGVRR